MASPGVAKRQYARKRVRVVANPVDKNAVLKLRGHEFAAKKGSSAFILPVGSGPGLKPDQLTSGCRRWRRGIVEHRPLASYSVREGGKERHILLAAETHDLLCRVGRDQREIAESIPFSTAHKLLGLRAECDVVRGSQKSSVDEAPSGGENVRVLYTESLRQERDRYRFRTARMPVAAREDCCLGSRCRQEAGPSRFLPRRMHRRAAHKHNSLAVAPPDERRMKPASRLRFQKSGILSLASCALDNNDHAARLISETSVSKQSRKVGS